MKPYVMLCLLLVLTETAAGWPRPVAQHAIEPTASPTAPAAEDLPRLSPAAAAEDLPRLSPAPAAEDLPRLSPAAAAEDLSRLSPAAAADDLPRLSPAAAAEDLPRLSPPEAADAERSGRPPSWRSGPGDRDRQRGPSSRGGDVFTTDDGLKDRHTADNDTHHGHVDTPQVEGDETEVSTRRTATAHSTTSRSTIGSSTTARSTTGGSTTGSSTTESSTTGSSTTEGSTTAPTKRKHLTIPELLAILRRGTRPLFGGRPMGGSTESYTDRTTESYRYQWTTHTYDRPRKVPTRRTLKTAIYSVVASLFILAWGAGAIVKLSRKRREAQARQTVGGQTEQPAEGQTGRPFGGQTERPFGGQTGRPSGGLTERPFGGQTGRPGRGQGSSLAVQTDNKVYCVNAA